MVDPRQRRDVVEDAAAEATRRQRLAAAPAASAWVTASAGSGKTKVLSDRVLNLLLAGTPPRHILCLTYTRAAAAEMANRINSTLGKWASLAESALAHELETLTGAPPDDATVVRARRLFAQVLDAPGGLNIQTIHAFCESLLRRFPLEAGIAPQFALMDERDQADALNTARETVIGRMRVAGDDPLAAAMAHVAGLMAEERFNEVLAELAKERGRFEQARTAHGSVDGLCDAVYASLSLNPGDTDEKIVAAACDIGDEAHAALVGAADLLLAGSKTDAARGEKIAAWLADAHRRGATFDEYASAFLTKDGEVLKRLATKASAAALPALEREAARVKAVHDQRIAAIVAAASAGLIRLADAVLTAYAAHKSANALLDYDDLILAARGLLARDGGVSWVHYKLDGGIHHVLVDEAQDTNPDQWEVVRALTEEFFAGLGTSEATRTVFAVGDTKQSIFSFQRAAPEAFEEMQRYFAERVTEAGQAWQPVRLDISFRSVEAILETVDNVFRGEDARRGLGDREVAIHHTANRARKPGRVELWPVAAPEKDDGPDETWPLPIVVRAADSPSDRVAKAIARRIGHWIDTGELLESRGRPIRPGDVMVLVRRRTGFVSELIRALKAERVPVAGSDRMVLTDQLAVMDLVALGEFLLLPEDDLTLATVLRGPFFRLDDDALFALAYDRGDRSLWRRLGEMAPGGEPFRSCHARLAELFARADFTPPYELFADILVGEGGRRRLLAGLGPESGDPTDELLALALAFERTHAPSLQRFLHWLRQGRSEIKRDLEHATRDEVRIMTVHGAKGLEAPIVFLGDTVRPPRMDFRLLWTEDGLPVWPGSRDKTPPALARPRMYAENAQEEEYRRLLYVAMTRAEDRLYVCGWGRQSEREDAPRDWYDMIRRGITPVSQPLAPALPEEAAIGAWDKEARLYARHEGEAAVPAPSAVRPAASVSPLPAWALRRAPAEPTPPSPIAASRPADEGVATASPLAEGRQAALRRGVLVHRLLQLLPTLAPEARAEAARAFLARPAHRLDAAEQEELAAETLAVLAEPALAPLFGPGSRAEVPVTGRVGDEIIVGRVDRLLVEGGRVAIVDFKTLRPPPERAEDAPEPYLRQMAAYRALLSGIYPDREIECSLLWTCGPRAMQLPIELLARHAP